MLKQRIYPVRDWKTENEGEYPSSKSETRQIIYAIQREEKHKDFTAYQSKKNLLVKKHISTETTLVFCYLL